MRIDLHLHTTYSSDSLNGLKEIVKRTRELGIVPAITDHNNTEAHELLRKMDFGFIPGEEIRTPEGDLIGLYLNEAIAKNTPFLEALDLINEQGGLSYLPHMYDNSRHGISEPKLGEKVDIIEVFNPRCLFEWENQKAKEFAIKHKKYIGTGSDSHFIMEIGNAYIETPDEDISEPKGLLKALRRGEVVGRKPKISMRGITTVVKYMKKVLKL